MPDPRPDAQPVSGEPCMTNCNVVTNIIGRARDIDVTPGLKVRVSTVTWTLAPAEPKLRNLEMK